MVVPLGVAKAVISDESYPLRFERFAADLVSLIEGGTRIVTTSSNYDQARDGAAVGAGPRAFLCCSLTDRVDAKAKADAKKLGKTTKNIERLYFCSSQSLTDYAGDVLAAQIGKLAGCVGQVTVLGVEKMAAFAATWDSVLRKHYPGEVQAALQALAQDPEASEHEHSLRLALSVAGTSDAAAIRQAVWGAALRAALSDGEPRTPAAISALLSNRLKLAFALRTDTLRVHLDSEEQSGFLNRNEDGTYVLSANGRTEFLKDEERVAASALAGRSAFGEAVSQALRLELTDSQTNNMWLAIQNCLATLLYERGREILELMAPLMDSSPAAKEAPEDDDDSVTPSEPSVPTRTPVHKDIVEPIASAAAAVFHFSDQGEEVRTAISDLLHSGYGPAVDWLTRSCFAFVCACSLGLEARTQAALESIIERTALVLDTDVVLSLLSIDEPPHESVLTLTREWREFGGHVLVTNDVLAEVAHHAWIAQTDLDHVADLLPATHLDRQVLSKNAFVRAFGRLLELNEVRPKHWPTWIRQFRGNAPDDLTAIRSTLIKDRGFGELPQPNAKSRSLATEVQAYIERKNQIRGKSGNWDSRSEHIRRDKARRDASLFASMVQALDAGHARGDGRATYLVTSSARFRDVERHFRHHESTFVLSVPAATYMLSMIPGRSLGLTALRSFLFDGRWQERVSDFQLLALRIVKRSGEFDMPWAKRSHLLRALRSRVESMARELSERKTVSKDAVDKLEDEWMTTRSDELSTALAQSLDQVAADRRTEDQLSAAQLKIQELEEQLANAKRALSRKPPLPRNR
jgi:hypothetical protein